MDQPQSVAVAVAAAFDISKYELADTAVLTFKAKDGVADLIGADGKNPAQARIYSPGSPQGVAAIAKSSKANGMRMARGMKGDFAEDEEEQAALEHAEKLAAFTAEFINFPVAAIEFYTNHRVIYLHRQVEQFIGKYANF